MRSAYHLVRSQILKRIESRAGRDPAAWAAAHPLAPPAADVTVRFLVPLISRAKAHDFARVSRNLGHTLASLARQTSDRWSVTICGQDRPEGVAFDGDRVRFLPFPIRARAKGSDKPRKQRFLIRDAAQGPARDGYIHFLDADDILHPRLVAHIVTDNNGHGYSVTHGWVVDFAARRIAPAVPPEESGTDTRPLYRLCGSSAALRFDLREGAHHVTPAFERGAHGNTATRVARFGLHLAPVPFGAVLYSVNHGDNLQIHRGLGDTKTGYLDAHALPPEEYAPILARFGLPPEGPAGSGPDPAPDQAEVTP